MMKPNLDPFRCPLCGSSNKCGVAAGEKTCWCFSEAIPKGVLQRLPAEARWSCLRVPRLCDEPQRSRKSIGADG